MKLSESHSRRRRQYKAYKSAYRERKQDAKKSNEFSPMDALVQEETMTRKIAKAQEHAKILVVEYRTLGMTENLVPLRNIYDTVKEMEKKRMLLRKIRRMNQDEDCRRHGFVMDSMRENLLWKNIYRMRMKSKSSVKRMSKNARKLEKEKDKLDTANSDADQALEYDGDDDGEASTQDDSDFLSWLESVCQSGTLLPVSPLSIIPTEANLSERLKELKLK